jgi:type VI secretion system secreted protein VgrG
MPEIGASTRFTFKVDGLSAPTWVARFEAAEGISTLFEVELTLTSEEKDIAFADVVGKTALLTLETDGSEPRHLHGIVSRFRHAEDGKKVSVYHATVVPRLWRLRHRHDSRIFQAKKVPDILQEVLKGGGVTDVRVALTGSYSPREYCVQYRESDLAFVSRLMEEEGIYYFFEHADGKHTLVLADAVSAPAPIVAPDTLGYRGTLGAMAHGESVSRWSSSQEVRPGKVSLTDYNFKKPSLSLMESSSAQLDPDLEVYDYPGEYDLPGDGSTYAKVRLEEWQARRTLADGESGCIRMTPGYVFTLGDHPRDAENQAYLITALRHRGTQPQMGEGAAGGEGPSYNNTFQAMPSSVPYRPERVTPRPTIKGVQTAIVTGPGGEEVHVDEHGRVKVHFHWDRLGKKDDTSSCWIRVSQLWAGAGWGAMWIPRIGHEVVVDFIEGDPDRPIIVGRVYHGANVPPYPLPAEKTKSTIKSDSSKGGGGFNELRFEDKKGSEEVYLQGEKDWKILIKHDKSQKIGHDETLDVGHNQAIHLGHDRTKNVDNDQSETIGGNKNIKVAKNHTESIDGDESLTIGGSARLQIGVTRSVTVAAAHDETIGLAQVSTIGGTWSKNVGAAASINVVGTKTESVGGTSGETVGRNKSTEVGGNYVIDVKKDFNTTVVENLGLTVKKDLKEDVEKNLTIVVGESISVKCGEVQIEIKKDGSIKVDGKDITVTGKGPIKIKGKEIDVSSDGAVNVKASGSVKVEGSKVDLN